MSKSVRRDDLALLSESVAAFRRKRNLASASVDFARGEVARLVEERKTLAINIDSRKQNKADSDTAEAMVADAESLLAIAETELSAAEASLAAGERIVRYNDALTRRDEAIAIVEQKFPKAFTLIAELQAAIRDADVQIAKANDDLPEGAERIAGVEGVMNRVGARPYELISDETRELWCHPDAAHEPLDSTFQSKVAPVGDGTGTLRGNAVDFGEFTRTNVTRGLVRKTFQVTRFKSADHGLHIEPILDIKLPPLRIERSDTRSIETRYALVREKD